MYNKKWETMLVAHDFLHIFNNTKNREHFRIPDFLIYFSSPTGGGWEGAFAPRSSFLDYFKTTFLPFWI